MVLNILEFIFTSLEISCHVNWMIKFAPNGTAVEVVYVTSAANRPVICPVRPGNCPGSKTGMARVFAVRGHS